MLAKDFSDKELEESYWLVAHWEKFAWFLQHLLVALSGIVVVYTLFSAVVLYGFQHSANREFHTSLLNALRMGEETKESPDLRIENSGILEGGAGVFDLYATVANPSQDWRVGADVIFSQEGAEVGRAPVFLFPKGSDTVSAARGAAKKGVSLTVTFENVRWDRMSLRDKEVLAQKHRLRIKDVRFLHAGETGISDRNSISKIVFTLTNETIYHFWEVGATVTLFSRGNVVGVRRIPILNVNAEEERHVEAQWYVPLGAVDAYRIVPQVDIFDTRSFRSADAPLQKL